MAVIDQTVLAQVIEEVKTAKEQLVAAFEQIKWLTDIFDTLNDVTRFLQDELDAIGRLGTIELPWANLVKSGNQLRRDIACLIPNLREMGISWKDLKFRSICEGKASYRKILFIPKDKAEEELSWAEHHQLRREAEARRRALYVELTTEALAMGHLIRETDLDEILRGIDDLDSLARRAENQNERLNIIAQGIVMMNRQLANVQKIQALQLQIQTAHFLADSVPVSSRGDEEGTTTGTGKRPPNGSGSSSGGSPTSGGATP